MKKIDKNKVNKEIIKNFRVGQKNVSPNKWIYNHLSKLNIGEAIEIKDAEWIGNTSVSTSIHGITRLRNDRRTFTQYTYVLSELGRQFIGKNFSTRKIVGGYFIIRNKDRHFRLKYSYLVKVYEDFLKAYSKETGHYFK